MDYSGHFWIDWELLGNLDPLRHFWHFGYLDTLDHFGAVKFVGSPKSQDVFPHFLIIIMFHPYLIASVWGFFLAFLLICKPMPDLTNQHDWAEKYKAYPYDHLFKI